MPVRRSTSPTTWTLPALAAVAGVVLLALSLCAGARDAGLRDSAGEIFGPNSQHAIAIEPQHPSVLRSSKRPQTALRSKLPPKKPAAIIAAVPRPRIGKERAVRYERFATASVPVLLRRQRARAPPPGIALS